MVFNNKKGILYGNLLKITMSLVFFMIVLSFVTTTFARASDLKPYLVECKYELGADRATQKLDILGIDVNSVCYTVKLDDLNDFKTPKYKKDFIARAMAQAWDVTWEGSDELFNDDSLLNYETSGYDCVTLFNLDYNNPKIKETITAGELNDYLIKETYHKKGMSYNNYFQRSGKGKYLILGNLTPGDNYAISILNPHGTSVSGSLLMLSETPLATTEFTFITAPQLVYALVSEDTDLKDVKSYTFDKIFGKDLNTIIVFSTEETAVNKLKCREDVVEG